MALNEDDSHDPISIELRDIVIGIVLSVVILIVGIKAYDFTHPKAAPAGSDTLNLTPGQNATPTAAPPTPGGSGLPGDQ